LKRDFFGGECGYQSGEEGGFWRIETIDNQSGGNHNCRGDRWVTKYFVRFLHSFLFGGAKKEVFKK